MKVEVERDTALRGYWVAGLGMINEQARKAIHWDGETIFIPDRVLNILQELKGGGYENQR